MSVNYGHNPPYSVYYKCVSPYNERKFFLIRLKSIRDIITVNVSVRLLERVRHSFDDHINYVINGGLETK